MRSLAQLASKYNILPLWRMRRRPWDPRNAGNSSEHSERREFFLWARRKSLLRGRAELLSRGRKDLHESFLRIKDHGRLNRSAEIHDTIGFNSKFTDLQAALALAQLRKLPERIEKKRALFGRYQERLRGISWGHGPADGFERASAVVCGPAV